MRIQRFALPSLILAIGLWCATIPPCQAADPAPISTSTGGLTLSEALDLAARNRQELKALRADLDVAAIALTHAKTPPNPELGLEWDNLGGDLPPDDVRETTVSFSQAIEVGGKPLARHNRSHAETLLLQQQQAMIWLDIAAEVRVAFLEVQGARERLALHHEAEQITTELANITHERVAAGELAATEEIRAEARKAEALAETQKLTRLLREAELGLATTIVTDDAIVNFSEKIPQEIAIPDRQTLLAAIDNTPLLALHQSEAQLAKSALLLERANSWSDPTLSLGVREIPDKDSRAIAIGLSIPIPLFQRNQTALAVAHATVQKANTNQEAAKRRLHTQLFQAHTVLVATHQEARSLRDEVLSRASEADEAVREGFRYGKFRYSDVLEASQYQVQVKASHLDAILELNRAAITLDRLLGKPSLPDFAQNHSSVSLSRSTP